jgi:hypothetical protein
MYREPARDELSDDELVGQELTHDPSAHLQKDLFQKAQRVLLQIDMTASPQELKDDPSLAVWRLAPHLGKELKQNTALRNRDAAGEADLAGNLTRCIPLQMTIKSIKNTLPFPVGLEAPGVMMSKTLHRTGACLYRVPPHIDGMVVDRPVFEPVNVVNRYMYENYRMCSQEDLDQDVQFQKARAGKPGRATVAVGSLAYEALVTNLKAGAWPEERSALDLDAIHNPSLNHTVEVTEKMGRQIVDMLKPSIEEAANAFVNLDDMQFKFVRADGINDWASPKGMHGEVTSSRVLKGDKVSSALATRRGYVMVEAELDYVLF